MRTALTFAVSCVIVRHDVDAEHPGQVVEPVVDHAQVLGVAVREEDGDGGVGAFDEEGGDARA